ncbi:MAG: 30S ribosomal protein S1 [Candidatus Coatesbacteria bacterium]
MDSGETNIHDSPGTVAGPAEPAEAGGFEEQFLGGLREVEEGELLKGHVVAIGEAEVVVDIGYKSEGVIPRAEFTDPLGKITVKPGDEIYVYLERKEGFDGEVRISFAKAERMRTWEKVLEAFEKQTPIDATLLRRVKGGLMADLGGVEAFLPGSQVALKSVANLDQFIGKTYPVQVLKLNKRRSNVVVSRRTLLETQTAKMREELMTTIQPGDRRKGVVKTLTAYGAFVDLGGVDGLLHITDMSWGRLAHPSQILKAEQEIEVVILAVDREKGKVSLGLKQKNPDPWTVVEQNYQAGQVYSGTVTSLAEYGAFVQLEEGVEGLVHVSELAWGHKIKSASEVVQPGQSVKIKLLSLDPKAKRVSLSLRQAESDPWSLVADRYPVGARVQGLVRGLADFGAFVEVEEGVEGLVHISDLAWSRKVKHPSSLLKKGDKVDVVVLGSDKAARRLSLGMKQLQADPWNLVQTTYRVGQEVKATITNVTSFGAFAALDDVIEGLIPLAHLSAKTFKKPEEVVQPGQEVMVKVTKIQPQAHKIALSIRLASQDSLPAPAAE